MYCVSLYHHYWPWTQLCTVHTSDPNAEFPLCSGLKWLYCTRDCWEQVCSYSCCIIFCHSPWIKSVSVAINHTCLSVTFVIYDIISPEGIYCISPYTVHSHTKYVSCSNVITHRQGKWWVSVRIKLKKRLLAFNIFHVSMPSVLSDPGNRCGHKLTTTSLPMHVL